MTTDELIDYITSMTEAELHDLISAILKVYSKSEYTPEGEAYLHKLLDQPSESGE